MLLFYVDDMLVEGSNIKEIVNLKARLTEEFSMKDLSYAKKFFEMRISRERKETIESITCRACKGAEEV